MLESDIQKIARFVPRDGVVWRAIKYVYYTPQRIHEHRRRLTKNGIFFREQELVSASLTPVKTINTVIELFQPKSVLDIGCGVGKSLDKFLEHGISTLGVEGSQLAISRAQHPELITEFNLNNTLNLGRKFDIVWSFEVVEHIHPNYVDNLVVTFSNHSDRIVMSAARPGQGGEGHFNEQLPGYWIDKFATLGYRYDETSTNILRATGESYSENIIVLFR
jgi:SAM-dependent methyltransferase